MNTQDLFMMRGDNASVVSSMLIVAINFNPSNNVISSGALSG